MVTTRPHDLPDFSDSASGGNCSFQCNLIVYRIFEQLILGLYWSEIRDRFPKTEEHGELPAQTEQPPESPLPIVGIHFEALEALPIPRLWFIDKEGTELIQVQRDRFIKNWRKVGEGDLYPRYEQVRAGFDQEFNNFSEFVSRGHQIRICPRRVPCEVAYINSHPRAKRLGNSRRLCCITLLGEYLGRKKTLPDRLRMLRFRALILNF